MGLVSLKECPEAYNELLLVSFFPCLSSLQFRAIPPSSKFCSFGPGGRFYFHALVLSFRNPPFFLQTIIFLPLSQCSETRVPFLFRIGNHRSKEWLENEGGHGWLKIPRINLSICRLIRIPSLTSRFEEYISSVANFIFGPLTDRPSYKAKLRIKFSL